MQPRYLADLELGRRNPSVRTLVRVANAFGIAVQELFKGDVKQRSRYRPFPCKVAAVEILEVYRLWARFRPWVNWRSVQAAVPLQRTHHPQSCELLVQRASGEYLA